MGLRPHELDLLQAAAMQVDPADVDSYLRLKKLLGSGNDADRAAFCKLFAGYYQLNSGGLTAEWKRRYFELLFAFRPGAEDPYSPLLRELYKYPRLKGDHALEFSFVSKLVAMHDESQPLYDRHVRTFFRLAPPPPGLLRERIAAFRGILAHIRSQYEAWATEPQFMPVLATLCQIRPGLAQCHPTRLCDLLVWTTGRNRLDCRPGGDKVG